MAKNKEIKLPNKTTMNLYYKENAKENNVPMFIVGLVLIAICVFLFTQFLVVNRLRKLNQLQGEVAVIQSEYDTKLRYLADYDEVKENYRRYTTEYLTKDKEKVVDREKIIHLLENSVEGLGTINNYMIVDNNVSLKVITKDLETVEAIKRNLDGNSYVTDVTIYTAATTNAGITSSIVFNVSQEGN